MMKKIVIVGAGGFGREVKIIIDAINEIKKEYNLLGFYDDNENKNKIINGIPVLGTVNDLKKYKGDEINVVISIGNPVFKRKIINELIENDNLSYPSIIHPKASVSCDDVVLGKGNIICEGVIITCNIEIDDFVILNLNCTVGHDTRIMSFSSFMPAVNISGEVLINENVYVGTGAKIINQLSIGENTVIGAGAVVSKTIPANCTAVGVPAKPIKFNN